MSACSEAVVSTMRRIESGWASRDTNQNSLPSSSSSYKSYSDLGICLAALHATVRGQFLSCSLRRTFPQLSLAVDTFHNGWSNISEYFYPNPRLLVPFAILLSLFTGVNTGSLLESRVADYTTEAMFGKLRFHWKIWKERAKRDQYGSIAQHLADAVHPEQLVAFLRRWTEYLRPLAHASDSQFLFLCVTLRGPRSVMTFKSTCAGPTGSELWTSNLDRFLHEHKLQHVTSRQFRVSALEIVHQVTGGDLRQMQAQANQKNLLTTEKHYVSDTVKKRDDERLVQIIQGRERWVRTGGQIDTRGQPENADITAATPGWGCLDPFSGYFDAPDTLCSAYGQCPICPFGSIDFGSVYACAQVHNLIAAHRSAINTMAPAAWLKRCAPVIDRLMNECLPRFPEAIHKESQGLYLPPLPVPE